MSSRTDSLKWNLGDKPLKAADKWDGSAVKNTLDDAVKKVFLENFGYVESHSLMNGRLVICTISVGFALFALLWDFIFPFPESRSVLIVCVISYFIMMGVLTGYTSLKEKGIFLIALEKDKAGIDPDNTWHISSQLKRYDDKYQLCISYTDGMSKETRSADVTKSVACYYDENGVVCMDLFEPEIIKMHTSLSSEKKDK